MFEYNDGQKLSAENFTCRIPGGGAPDTVKDHVVHYTWGRQAGPSRTQDIDWCRNAPGLVVPISDYRRNTPFTFAWVYFSAHQDFQEDTFQFIHEMVQIPKKNTHFNQPIGQVFSQASFRFNITKLSAMDTPELSYTQVLMYFKLIIIYI